MLYKEIWVTPKIMVLTFGTLSIMLDLENFATAGFVCFACDGIRLYLSVCPSMTFEQNAIDIWNGHRSSSWTKVVGQSLRSQAENVSFKNYCENQSRRTVG